VELTSAHRTFFLKKNGRSRELGYVHVPPPLCTYPTHPLPFKNRRRKRVVASYCTPTREKRAEATGFDLAPN
jgi:hypothetical protein